MNPKSARAGSGTDARESINRVLRAEREMVEALVRCRQRAEEIVDEARDDARQVLRRTEARVNLLHQRFEDAIAERVRAIESAFDAAACADASGGDEQALLTAVDSVAQALTRPLRDGS